MAVEAQTSRSLNQPENFIRAAIVWHLLLTMGLLWAAGWVYATETLAWAAWQRWSAMGGLGALAVGSVAASAALAQKQPRGRVLSLGVNYLVFILALIFNFHWLGIFLGLDALGKTFGNGLLWLGVVFVGYLINAYGDRVEGTPQEKTFRRAGNWVMAGGFAVFLLAVGLLDALVWLGGQLVTTPSALILTTILILCGVGLWMMWQRPVAEALGAKHTQDELIEGYLFLSPNLLGFLIFFAGPLLLSLYVSFTNWDAFGTRDWVGLDNYAKIFNVTFHTLASPTQLASEVMDVKVYDEVGRVNLLGFNLLFGAEDKLFWLALRNTLTFVLLAVPGSVIPALLLATILNSKLPGMRFFRAVYFIPSIAAVVGISIVWQWLYNASIGWINYFITLGVNGLNNLFNLNLVDPQIRWLSSVDTALLSIVIVSIWQTLGFNSVLFLAGLQNIPNELYEAATVDGANEWRKFWSITLPLLAPTTFFVVSTTIIQALQVFEQIYVMTSATGADAGGPNNSTLSLVLYLYQTGFRQFEQGYASAVAWVLFFVIFIFTLAQFQRQRQSSLYES